MALPSASDLHVVTPGPQALSSPNVTTTALTPSSSSANSTTTYIGSSNNGLGASNTTNVPGRRLLRPSPQLLAYLMQPATNDGAPYWRFVGTGRPQQPASAVCPYSRIGHYTVRAQQNTDRLEVAFESDRGGQ
ncbi:hypothetical protein MFIFM68171_03085 [Madurella fahalii]|uniref:Uncharacterized protein n=1 Tax=Madurella fahalii TaxID=1157608 RepID=A0ABQ0G535_9PEZI